MQLLEGLWRISRKQIHFEVVASREIALKRIARPNFKHAKIFREDMVGIHMAKPVLVMNRPIQVGFAIPDLSKYLMYDFHYNTWMKKVPNSTHLFTDTEFLDLIYMLELLKSRVSLTFQSIRKITSCSRMII